ncbi:MAG TPA: CBS domain-containing protein, partial [Corynebacterium sp.]|nr:CBS domain-containing protein [Corynebacterium sp.]
DLERVIETSRDSGDLDGRTYLVLDRMLEFPEQDVTHAMIPRSRVAVLAPDTTVTEARREMDNSHTRFPVIDGDHIPVGVVSLLDVLDRSLAPDTPISEIMSAPTILHELMSLPDAVSSIRSAQNKMACVIDEYGGFVGIITLEDLGEEILGDITDRHEATETEEITESGEDIWLADGDTPVDEVIRAVGYELPTGDYETLSGLLLSESGGLVAEGETITFALDSQPEDFIDGGDELPKRELQAKVLEVDRNVPSAIRLTLIDPDHPDPTPESAPGEEK